SPGLARSPGRAIHTTSPLCSSPSAPIFTNLTTHVTRPSTIKTGRGIIPIWERTPNHVTGPDPGGTQRRRALTEAVVALAPVSGMTAAVCAAVGVSRATVERRRSCLAAPPAIAHPRPTPVRALTAP